MGADFYSPGADCQNAALAPRNLFSLSRQPHDLARPARSLSERAKIVPPARTGALPQGVLASVHRSHPPPCCKAAIALSLVHEAILAGKPFATVPITLTSLRTV